MGLREEAIDKGARAIHSIDAYWVDHAWETLPEEARALFTRQATVAFDATREVMSPPPATKMSAELAAALERARRHVMTPEEVFEQRVSFVYGQQDHDSPNPRTKDQIRQTMIEIYGRPSRKDDLPV